MQPTHMLVAARMADRLREAEHERLGRGATRARPAPPVRSIVSRLTATGEALRAPADDCLEAKVSQRPA